MMNIQLAKYKDIRKVSNCLAKSLKAGGSGCEWLSEIDRIEWHIEAKECYVAKIGNRIVGVMCLEFLDTLDIESLGILEKYRHKGLGHKFIQKAFDLAKKNQYNRITLGSCKEFQVQDFYKKLGFKIVDIDSYGDFEFEYRIKKEK